MEMMNNMRARYNMWAIHLSRCIHLLCYSNQDITPSSYSSDESFVPTIAYDVITHIYTVPVTPVLLRFSTDPLRVVKLSGRRLPIRIFTEPIAYTLISISRVRDCQIFMRGSFLPEGERNRVKRSRSFSYALKDSVIVHYEDGCCTLEM